MKLYLLAALALTLAACADADAPPPDALGDGVSEAGPLTSAPETVEAAPPADAPEAPRADTYACASGETITLARDGDALRYTLDGREVVLAREADGRYATEAMWVTFETPDRVTVTRDEDSRLDCTRES